MTNSRVSNNSEIELHGITAALHDRGILTFDELMHATQRANEQGVHLSTYLVKNSIISNEELLDISKIYFGVPIANIRQLDTELLHNNVLQPELIERYHVLPIKKDGDSLQLGMTNPADHDAIAAIRFHTGLRIHPMLIDENSFERTINTYYRPNILYSQLQDALARMDKNQNETENDDEPVATFVTKLLTDAINKKASDIHIEMNASTCRVRFRCDGLLHHVADLPNNFAIRVITRFKIMSDMDITERRLPQDGRFMSQTENKIDIRASTCPSLNGEKLVLRLLQTNTSELALDKLGMQDSQLKLFRHALAKPQGLIIVTGPTGCGKTATLYAALNELNSAQENILTVEDPVEIQLPGLTQVNINSRIGLSFTKALRAFLRQDPDIIMIGEIRDKETAEIALQAAQTGHLVLSTLHTNCAADTIKRLLAMGIPSYLLADSLTLIVAQRLLRTLCKKCHGEQNINCTKCNNGYSGRTGIFEILPITTTLSHLLLKNATSDELESHIHHQSHLTLHQAGLLSIKNNLTSTAELERVIGATQDAKENL